ncbi:MAG TPA: PE-PPE domain-containing protein, partial [Mycobacterium sp.]|nr:PE-PPE domain-containing protein [Mycobacterium sp.]
MRVIARSLAATLLALLSAVVLAVSWTTATAVQLQAVTALIMGGANHSLAQDDDPPEFVTAYLDNAVDSYINPAADAGTGTTGSPDNLVAVIYPAEFFPVFGSKTFDESVAEGRQNLHRCLDASGCVFNDEVGSEPPAPDDTFIVFGYSESAVVASLVKRDLIDDYQPGHTASFILVSNAMRGNGGILMRGFGLPTIPIFGITFYGATPTNSPVIDPGDPQDPLDDVYAYPTVDVAQQYDALGGDFPYRPLNLLATANALAGYYYLHEDVVERPLTEAEFQGRHGDTTYYLFTADILPILMPLQDAGVPSPILRLLDAPLRVAIEDAYLR